MRRWIVLGAALLIGGGPLSFLGCSSPSLTAGKLYLKQQQYDLAMQQLELAVSEDSTDAQAYYHLGRAYGLAGYYADMVVAFDRSLTLSSKYSEEITDERLHYWSRIYNDGVRITSLSHPDLLRAQRKYRLATQILPDRLAAWRNLGYTQFSIGEMDEAIATFEYVTQQASEDTASLRVLGTLYLSEGRPAEAIPVFEKALVVAEKPWTLTNLGVAHTRVGDMAAAEQVYDRVVAIRPEHWQCHYNLGSLYWQQGRAAEARVAYERAIDLNPDDIDVRYNLAVVYLGLEQLDDAFPLLQQLTQDMPDNATLWRELGRVYTYRGMEAESRDAYRRAESLGE